jgi:hypothetical protein
MTLLDYIIRNQGVIFGTLGGLVTLGLLYLLHAQTPRTRQIRIRLGLPDLGTVPVSLLPLAALAVGSLIGQARPLSSTFNLSLPKPLCAKPDNTNLLLFIHGWSGDETTWKNFPSLACGDTGLKNTDVVVVHYPTFITKRDLNLITLADWIKTQVDTIKEQDSYQQIRIIAHSMGGLVAREFTLLKSTNTPTAQTIDLLIEVATPHLGAPIAQLEKLKRLLGIESSYVAQDVQPDSSYLRGLHTRWKNLRPRPWTICFTSPQDNIVAEDSATYQCDDHLTYPAGSHTELVKPQSPTDPRYVLPMREIFKRQNTKSSYLYKLSTFAGSQMKEKAFRSSR